MVERTPPIYGGGITVIAHKDVISEGILDFAHFPLFSGTFSQFPAPSYDNAD